MSYFWLLFIAFLLFLFPNFISHPRRQCKCHGNDMLFGIHEDYEVSVIYPMGLCLVEPWSKEVLGDE